MPSQVKINNSREKKSRKFDIHKKAREYKIWVQNKRFVNKT